MCFNVDNAQRQLSDYQVTPFVGPLVVSPAKLLLSLAQLVYGAAKEIFFGTLTTVAEICEFDSLAKRCDQLCYEGVKVRRNGFRNFISAGYNIITFGQYGQDFEYTLGLRHRAYTKI